jgi:hypothetical protein
MVPPWGWAAGWSRKRIIGRPARFMESLHRWFSSSLHSPSARSRSSVATGRASAAAARFPSTAATMAPCIMIAIGGRALADGGPPPRPPAWRDTPEPRRGPLTRRPRPGSLDCASSREFAKRHPSAESSRASAELPLRSNRPARLGAADERMTLLSVRVAPWNRAPRGACRAPRVAPRGADSPVGASAG